MSPDNRNAASSRIPSARRRALVTFTAVISVLLVSITIGLLTSLFGLEMRRTRELQIGLQRDHLFHAAALVALARVRAAAPQPGAVPADESLPLPAALAADTTCHLHFAAPAPHVIVITITIRTTGIDRLARLTLEQRTGTWTPSDWR